MTKSSPIVNAMTVDVEDYFQVSAFESIVPRARWDDFERRVARNTDRLLGIFAEHKVLATFFVLGWVAEREPALVRRIADAGHEIASHGHAHRLVYDQRPAEFREDVRRSKELLEAATGRPVIGYRAPSFSITDRSLWAFDILFEEGFRWDASVFPIRHDRYGIPGAPRHPHRVRDLPTTAWEAKGPGASLLEIPASTVRIAGMNLPVAGGGYFRMLPYAWTQWGLSRLNRNERQAAVFYLHPWEVDPGQPRLDASWLNRTRHYSNLSKTGTRLRRLLSDFRFDTIGATIIPSFAAKGHCAC